MLRAPRLLQAGGQSALLGQEAQALQKHPHMAPAVAIRHAVHSHHDAHRRIEKLKVLPHGFHTRALVVPLHSHQRVHIPRELAAPREVLGRGLRRRVDRKLGRVVEVAAFHDFTHLVDQRVARIARDHVAVPRLRVSSGRRERRGLQQLTHSREWNFARPVELANRDALAHHFGHRSGSAPGSTIRAHVVGTARAIERVPRRNKSHYAT
mmetsp:Transcript_3692/g.10716  ORF Transcript_3692/g.10716 Transcript_3692/m.10716 type:complete len:209 (-) Transcript_3692:38-664(-)